MRQALAGLTAIETEADRGELTACDGCGLNLGVCVGVCVRRRKK